MKREGKYNYYVHGNLASKLQEQTLPQHELERRIVKRKVNALNHKKIAKKMSFILFTVIIMASALSLVISYSKIYNQYEKIKQLENQLGQINKENTLLERKISKKTNLNEVYKIATTKLNMIPKSKNNVRYISISKNSYTQQFEQIEEKDNKHIFSVLFNMLN